jgi:5'/3'-nucleotidase SurE
MDGSMEGEMQIPRTLKVVVAASLLMLANPASALDIALTNDDGWEAMGITVMKEALEAAGHTVTLAAPLTDQSGGSMALDMSALTVTKRAPGVYSVALYPNATVAAKPANCALAAIGIVQESGHAPDLLVSGINTSANIGMAALLSGTVGAASHAVASVMNGPVPAIAVGTDEPVCDPDCKRAHYEVVADFVVRFVAHLETKPGFLASESKLLPDGVGLVISYPTSDTIQGVKVASLSNAVLMGGQRFTGGFMCSGTGCSGLAVNASQRSRIVPMPDETSEVKNADLEFYLDGYVTIVPITPDITATSPLVFKSVVAGFTP